MRAEQIARSLGGYKRPTGAGWHGCKCPVHDDQHASMTVRDDPDKGVIVQCHKGCSWQEIRAELEKRGWLEPFKPHRNGGSAPPAAVASTAGGGREMANSKQENGATAPLSRVVAEYHYTDEAGNPLYVKQRREPKDFRIWTPAPRDPTGKVWGLKSERRVLYNLPLVVQNQRVFVVEGEKDADRLVSLALCATTNVEGAGPRKWGKSYAAQLQGKDVVLIPDNDPVGLAFMEEVAKQLASVAKSVRMVRLPALPEKGDVSDWLDAGHTADELLREADATPPWTEGSDRDPNWRGKLQYSDSEKPKPLNNEFNATVALKLAPELTGTLRYNVLLDALEARREPFGEREEWVRFQDHNLVAGLVWLQGAGLENLGFNVFARAAIGYALREGWHDPVKEHLVNLPPWDGKLRLDEMFQTYFGAREQDPAYLRAVARVGLVQLVARAMEPGCKADHCVVLEGPQGCGKSTSLRILGGEWYKDQLAGAIDSRDGKKSVSTAWLIELSELAAISTNRAEIEHIKAFISAQVDEYRSPYDRLEKHRPRRGVPWGTTNRSDYLQDETGNRRFLPVKCGLIDLAAFGQDRDQLLAEALTLYRAGEPRHFVDPSLRALAQSEQEARVTEDPWHHKIMAHVQGLDEVHASMVAVDAIGLELGKVGKAEQMRIGKCLTKLGFERCKVWLGDRRVQGWRRKGETEAEGETAGETDPNRWEH
jgi:predicted P-loop ATPase